ncbi:MAG: DNA primase [Clostridiaceae bacterium]|jgi:DNA primase|nr:DNA primase [Clostridiaceae bacterium]
MQLYSDDIIEEVRLNNDIVSVVSEYLHLEKKGGGYFGLCPFHREKTPSFYVEPAKQLYYCFGCNNGGNIFHFIMNIENLDFQDALRLLADKAGILLPDPDDSAEQGKIKLRKDILEANKEAGKFYYSNLAGASGKPAQDYFFKRGLSTRTIKKFGLGFAPDEWDLLTRFLLARGFDEKILVESGLSLRSKKGNLYDRFRNRIMFPIFNIRGDIVAFGGRVLDDTLPKYINSPETVCFSKGRELFGMNLARKSAEKKLLIVEGYMDVISLHQAGIDYAVASLGTALTDMQGRIIKKYADEVILSYDTDMAGRKATERGLDVLEGLGCRVKVLQVPGEKDPDEFIRKNGADKFKNLVERAISILEYKIMKLREMHPQDSQDNKLSFLNGVADLLAEQDNIMEREIVMKNISRDYDITMDTLQVEVKRRQDIKMRKQKKKEFNTAKKELTGTVKSYSIHKDNKKSLLEKMLIALISSENHLYGKVRERYPISAFTEGPIRKMAEVLYEKLEQGNGFILEEYITRLDPEEASAIIHMARTSCNFEESEKALEDILKKLEILKLEEEKKDILKRLKNITDINEKKLLQNRLNKVIQKITGM